jgi:hypothetical protein
MRDWLRALKWRLGKNQPWLFFKVLCLYSRGGTGDILACFPYFEKIQGGLWNRLAVCVCVPPLTTESRNNGARRGAVARQRLGKHVPPATNIHATTEELLDEVFSMQPMSYQIFNMQWKESRRVSISSQQQNYWTELKKFRWLKQMTDPTSPQRGRPTSTKQ